MPETLTAENPTTMMDNSQNEFKLYNADDMRKGALILRAMNHKLRRQILSFVDTAGKTNVTDLYKALQIEQSVASQHLGILRTAQLVKTERTGKQIWYSVNHDRIAHYQEKVKALLA